MSDLIKYDRECNYIDMRNQNSNNILNECSSNNNNVNSICNIKNSDLNAINEKTDKFMNENMLNVFVDNNLLNISDNSLIYSLTSEQNNIKIDKPIKNSFLNIYSKDEEDKVIETSINGSGNIIDSLNQIEEEYTIKNNNIKPIINYEENILIEESLENINNGNDISQFTNEIKNIDTLELFGLSDINLENLLNENLE
tara:strand:- start:5593 stop:6186 length:594 start_codon:yes stop_codon:yes gene_type:complete